MPDFELAWCVIFQLAPNFGQTVSDLFLKIFWKQPVISGADARFSTISSWRFFVFGRLAWEETWLWSHQSKLTKKFLCWLLIPVFAMIHLCLLGISFCLFNVFSLVTLQGAVCTERCSEGRFGQNCAEECVCHNRGKCDPESGQCQCAKGFTGNRCVYKCFMLFYFWLSLYTGPS